MAWPQCRYHPISGNDRAVSITTANLLEYLRHTGHTPVVVDFAENKVVSR